MPNFYRALGLSLTYFVVMICLIFYFDLKIYYKFYDENVLLFWMFWKALGFFLLFDKLHTKFWLFLKLRFQSIHSHGIEWKEKLKVVKNALLYEGEDRNKFLNNLKELAEDKIRQAEENEDEEEKRISLAVKEVIDRYGEEIQKVYKDQISSYYKKILTKN